MGKKVKLLVATTTWWPSVAILASALEQAGFDVTVLCPQGHLAWYAKRYRCLPLDSAKPVGSLADAITLIEPALIVPGDERAVSYLLDLHRCGARFHDRVERSLGPESSFQALTSRVPLLTAAASVGVPVPPGRNIGSRSDLDAWMAAVPGPWVIKVDGAWGGEGVRIARTHAEGRAAFRALTRGLPLAMALKKRIINGDPFGFEDRKADRRPSVSVQQFVRGRPGNCVLFAHAGQLLGATIVETEKCCGDRGPSTLVRVVERPAFLAAVERLVRTLGLSGFFGLDFMVEDDTDVAFLIEMNPRITGPCHIRTSSRTDPITAAAVAFGCEPLSHDQDRPPRRLFASFPLAWQIDPHDQALASCQADVPWHEPALVEHALKPIWPESGFFASLPAWVRAVKRTVTTGVRVTDYRSKPFSWWLAGGFVRLPPHIAQHGDVSPGPNAPRDDCDAPLPADPAQALP